MQHQCASFRINIHTVKATKKKTVIMDREVTYGLKITMTI